MSWLVGVFYLVRDITTLLVHNRHWLHTDLFGDRNLFDSDFYDVAGPTGMG